MANNENTPAGGSEPTASIPCGRCGTPDVCAIMGCASAALDASAPASAPPPLTDGWHPIATAPKDDTVFLAYRNGQVRETRVLVRSDGELWSFGGIQWFPSVFPDRPLPTHWRPMLAAPGECLAAAPVADERAEFETAMARAGYELNPQRYWDGPYRSREYEAGWAAWQARAALSGGSPEPVSGSEGEEEGGRVE